MNERIKKLLEQATNAVDPENRVWVFSEVDQAKFAELIVKECADFIDSHKRVDEYGQREIIYGVDLMKHFGVGK
jgi:hypothetical protein